MYSVGILFILEAFQEHLEVCPGMPRNPHHCWSNNLKFRSRAIAYLVNPRFIAGLPVEVADISIKTRLQSLADGEQPALIRKAGETACSKVANFFPCFCPAKNTGSGAAISGV